MKKFLLKSLLIFVPALIYVVLITLADPFNYFKISGLIRDEVKVSYSSKINYGLWKVLRFYENSEEEAVLGDSRVMGLDYAKINSSTGDSFFDFSIAGGTLQEIKSAFELIKSRGVKKLYIGVNFNSNLSKTKDRISGAVDIYKNPLLYYTNTEVIESAFLCVVNAGNENLFLLEQPDIQREDFWKFLLEKSENEFLKNFRYPDDYILIMKEIINECNKNNIKVTLFHTPNHVDFRALLKKYSIESSFSGFKSDLKAICTGNSAFIDLEDDSLIVNKDKFNDPFHLKKDVLTDLFINKVIKNN